MANVQESNMKKIHWAVVLKIMTDSKSPMSRTNLAEILKVDRDALELEAVLRQLKRKKVS